MLRIQNSLRKKLDLRFSENKCHYVAGCDVAYVGDHAVSCLVVVKIPEFVIVETSFHSETISFPYIPGFLAFREGKLMIDAIKKIRCSPDVFIVDGHGIAHPERMGLASYIGVYINKPVIGCAKSLLTGKYKIPGNYKGDYTFIIDDEKIIGAAVRTRPDAKVVFVSPGNKIDLENSIKIVLACTGKFRLPQPLRIAHMLANKKAKTFQIL
ncbi:MAG: endonuclease V [Candidatus Ratteibacteria bacterium]